MGTLKSNSENGIKRYLFITGITSDGFKTECIIPINVRSFARVMIQWKLNGTSYQFSDIVYFRKSNASHEEIRRYLRPNVNFSQEVADRINFPGNERPLIWKGSRLF